MARKSSIPQEILQYVPAKCCRVRCDGDIFRVYKYKAVKLTDGSWSSDWGYLIGKIIPNEGFFPNKRYRAELAELKGERFPDEITDLGYGAYALLQHVSKDIYKRLEEEFDAVQAAQIYSYALILCVNGFLYVDQIDDYYQESILSIAYGYLNIKMGYTALSNLLNSLGSQQNPVQAFEQKLLDDCSRTVAIDGHVVRSCSEKNDLAEEGYKARSLKAGQVNILIAYDAVTKIPLMFRTFRGSSVDKKSCVELLRSRRFQNTKFLVDRGFYSRDILKLMSSDGNSYIIPVMSNNKDLAEMKKDLQYSSGEFIYRVSAKSSSRIVYQEKNIGDGKRLIVFKDLDENNSMIKSYIFHMEKGEPGYTQEGLSKYRDWWGVYALETSTTENASQVFSDYKSRWGIETFNNYLKNGAGFNNLKFQSYYEEQGFDFIMLVTGLIHQKLNDAVSSLKKSSISTIDMLIISGHLRMVKENDEWHLRNTRKKDLELLEAIGFTPQETYDRSEQKAIS